MYVLNGGDLMTKYSYSKAFRLKPIQDPITIVKFKEGWYPKANPEDSHVFVRGSGSLKVGKRKTETIPPLKEYTAQAIQDITNQYGFNVTLGLIQGWCNQSLFHDGSYGLAYHKFEVRNMAIHGKTYDIFINKVKAISDEFVEALIKKGFRFDGGTLWYKENLIGFIDHIQLYPIEHIEHCLTGIIPMYPNFNPISFDNTLVNLFRGRYKNSQAMLDKYVSVYDRIKQLTNKTIADKIKNIFELQKVFEKE
jgi:hypothetical protein